MPPPSFLDRARTRIASGAAAAGLLLSNAVRPPAVAPAMRSPPPPFGQQGYPGDGRPNIPPPAVNADQPPPPPTVPKFDPQYHGRTFRAYNYVRTLGGWDVGRMRAAIEAHDIGIFLESYTLALACSRFGPIHAALRQRIAPVLGVERHILGGPRGLSRVVREEVEADLAPSHGEMASPTFPPSLWGAMALDHALMDFAILQHVYGEPDALGVRPVYSRIWPMWAVQCMVYRRTYQALTLDGPVDIIDGDGKWSIVATSDLPHLTSAVRALGSEYLDGGFAKASRANYIDRYGDPKPVGITTKEGIAPNTPEGDANFAAIDELREPGAWGLLPFGIDVKMLEMSAQTSGVFDQALQSVWQYIAAILLGSDGTMTRGTGVYSAPIFAGVRLDLIRDDLKAITRAVNFGRTRPWAVMNYGADLKTIPVLSMPLPDPDQDARIKSYTERRKALTDQIKADREAGLDVTQESIEAMATKYGVEAPTLSATLQRIDLADADRGLVYRVSEVRAGDGHPPLGDERDDLTVAELQAIAKQKASANEQAATSAEKPGEAPAAPPTVPATPGPAETAHEAKRTESDGGKTA